MTTDTSERGLERLICTALTGSPCDPAPARPTRCASGRRPTAPAGSAASPRTTTASTASTSPSSRPSCARRSPRSPSALDLDQDGPTRRKFLARLQGEISKRGVIDVLRHGIKHGPHHLDLFYGTPSPGNAKADERYAAEPLQRHPPAPLQPRRDAARARPVPLHQRPAGRHVRAEEQPHQADGRGRGRAVQARPRPARAAVRVRPLRGALRRGRPRGALLHAAARARPRGSCPSTRAGTTAPATRPTRTASRPTTSGSRS